MGVYEAYAIPWVLVLALLAGSYVLYSSGKGKDADLAQLRTENADLPKLRAENEELKKLSGQVAEVDRLRKDNEDLLRLRNEVRQLREQGQLLTNQIQSAQAEMTQAQQQQQQAAKLAAENQALRTQTQQIQQAQQAQTQAQAQTAAACLNNLRQLDGAKQAWALQNQKPAGAVPAMADLAPYLPAIAQMVCPGGGAYSLNGIGQPPTCSIPGHVLR